MQSEGYKRCGKCGEAKPQTEFYRHRTAADGLRTECKACHRASRRQWRIENWEHVRETERRYSAKVRDERPGELSARTRAWRERHPAYAKEMKRAHQLVQDAILRGDLSRPGACSECGASGLVHGHHEDYAKPLDVLWLCARCHRRRHSRSNN